MSPWRQRLAERCAAWTASTGVALDAEWLLARDRSLGPAGRAVSPNGACEILRAADTVVALSLARDEDRELLPAWLELDHHPTADDLRRAIAARPAAWLRERATLVGLPFAVTGEAAPRLPLIAAPRNAPVRGAAGVRVLDLSVLWAGPLCGALLAGAGATVTRWEAPERRDPTALTTPDHYRRLNGAKRLVVRGLEPDAIREALSQSDILVTSARPPALGRLGLVPEEVFAAHPDLVWIAVTAHGWSGAGAQRVGFGDDCAVAGGLVGMGANGPVFIGDALADPLTGLEAATAGLEALQSGSAGLVDAALASTAAWYAAADE